MYEYKFWKPWRYRIADDTLLTTWEPSNHPGYVNPTSDIDAALDTTFQLIKTKELSVIAIKAFGVNADNEDCRLRIAGWMENGPGQMLVDATITLGGHTWNELPAVSSYRNVFPATAVFEVDTWDLSVNACRAYVDSGGVDTTTYLVMQTMQYRYLQCELDLDGGSNACAGMGLIWRELA